MTSSTTAVTLSMANKAVFFDRDGTLNVDIHYLHRPEDFEWIPEAKEAIKYVNDHGYLAILVTNQSGVAGGYYPESDVRLVYDWMNEQLAVVGAHLDALYYCPHHPDGRVSEYAIRCECRKPGRGLVDRAARELGIDPARSFTVGDRWVDVGLARTIGGKGVLVRTGYGYREEVNPQAGLQADAVVNNLVEAVSWILETVSAGSQARAR